MSILIRVLGTVVLTAILSGSTVPSLLAQPAPAAQGPTAQGAPTTAAQDEYVPIDQLPEAEQVPAAPFLIAAYAVAWAAILIYVLMLWRRLGRVEHELREVRRTTGGR